MTLTSKRKTINIGAYDNFNHVKSPELRTWNRVATLFAIRGDEGKEAALRYRGQFDEVSQKMIDNMLEAFQKEGQMQVRQRVMKAAFNE